MSDKILTYSDIEIIVQSLKKSSIDEIGSLNWFDAHRSLEQLRQQAFSEASACVEEQVKDVILNHNKVPVLIYEVILIQVWREKILPRILNEPADGKKLTHGFIGYMILYHQCTALNLLQILLYHRDVIQCLEEEALDLIDFCVEQTVRLCSESVNGTQRKKPVVDADERERFLYDAKEMELSTGLAAIAILSSFSQVIDDLSISCTRRLYNTHDVPLLFASALELQPWKRTDGKGVIEVYSDGQWGMGDSEELCKIEAQCWMALHGLLLHDAAKRHYEATAFRKQNLTKLLKYLHEQVLDQISPLVQLKQFLSQLSMWDPPREYKSLIIECLPEIRNNLMAAELKWNKLVKKHINLIFAEEGNNSLAIEIAKRVAETYDADMLASLTPEQKPTESCAKCKKTAYKKCSRCRQVWYCSRDCQVKSWPEHKLKCATYNKSSEL